MDVRSLVVGCSIALCCCGGTVVSTGTPGGQEGGTASVDGSVVISPPPAGSGTTGTTPPPTDGGTREVPEAGPGQTVCGTTTCNAASQVCCRTEQGSTCTAVNACNGVPEECSSAASCGAGDVCCATIGGGGGGGRAAQTTCEAKCGFGSVELCTVDSDCPDNERCRMVGMSGLSACERNGGPPMLDGGPVPPMDGGIFFADAARD